MNSKERVRAAIRHKQPDQVPADFGCVPEVWEKLQRHFHTDAQDEVLDRLGIDIRYIDADYIGPPLQSYELEGERVDENCFGWKSRRHWNGVEYNNIAIDLPLDNISSAREVLDYRWPSPDWFDYDSIKRKCDQYQDKAIMIGHAGLYQWMTFMRNAEKIFLEMALDPDIPKAMIHKLVEFELEYYSRILEAADGRIDILQVYDDYGTQNGLLLSKEMWREFFAENLKKLTGLAHRHGAFFMQHSCGAVQELIPDLIACGVDILDPIQKVPGMEIERLKQAFGDKLTFHGGIDTQKLLPFGTPQEVERATEYTIDLLNRNGGYILCSSQYFENDVPLENLLAVYRTRDLKYRMA